MTSHEQQGGSMGLRAHADAMADALERSYDAVDWPADDTSDQEIAAAAYRAAFPKQAESTDFDSWLRSYTQSDGRGYALPIVRAAFEAGVKVGEGRAG